MEMSAITINPLSFPSPVPGGCSTGQLVTADPLDCHAFHQCTPLPLPAPSHRRGTGAGPGPALGSVRRSCGFLLFNPSTLTCDWPDVVVRVRPECRKTFSVFGREDVDARGFRIERRKLVVKRRRRRKRPKADDVKEEEDVGGRNEIYFPLVDEEDGEHSEEVQSPLLPGGREYDYVQPYAEPQEEREGDYEPSESRVPGESEEVPLLNGGFDYDYGEYDDDPGDDSDEDVGASPKRGDVMGEVGVSTSITLGPRETLVGVTLNTGGADGEDDAAGDGGGQGEGRADPRNLNGGSDFSFPERTPYPVRDDDKYGGDGGDDDDHDSERRPDLSFIYDPFVTPFQELLPNPLLPKQDRSEDEHDEVKKEEEENSEQVGEEDIQAAIESLFGDPDDYEVDEDMPYSVHAKPHKEFVQLPLIKNRKSFFAKDDADADADAKGTIFSKLAGIVRDHQASDNNDGDDEVVSVDFDQGLVEHPRFIFLHDRDEADHHDEARLSKGASENANGRQQQGVVRPPEFSTFYPILSQEENEVSEPAPQGEYFPTSSARSRKTLRSCLDAYYDCLQDDSHGLHCEEEFGRCHQGGATVITSV